MAEDDDLVLSEACADDVNELIEISDELLHCHRRFGDARLERPARATLIPVDDREALFEDGVEIALEP